MYKNITIVGFLVFLLFSLTSMAYADGLTFGAKTGPMHIDVAGADDPTNAGVSVGTELGVVLGDIGVEGEFTTTMNEGSNGESVDTMGLYATYRSPGFLYFKARGGFVRWDSDGEDDTNTSLGLGLGLSLAVVKVELEVTQIDDDVDFISIGVQF